VDTHDAQGGSAIGTPEMHPLQPEQAQAHATAMMQQHQQRNSIVGLGEMIGGDEAVTAASAARRASCARPLLSRASSSRCSSRDSPASVPSSSSSPPLRPSQRQLKQDSPRNANGSPALTFSVDCAPSSHRRESSASSDSPPRVVSRALSATPASSSTFTLGTASAPSTYRLRGGGTHSPLSSLSSSPRMLSRHLVIEPTSFPPLARRRLGAAAAGGLESAISDSIVGTLVPPSAGSSAAQNQLRGAGHLLPPRCKSSSLGQHSEFVGAHLHAPAAIPPLHPRSGLGTTPSPTPSPSSSPLRPGMQDASTVASTAPGTGSSLSSSPTSATLAAGAAGALLGRSCSASVPLPLHAGVSNDSAIASSPGSSASPAEFAQAPDADAHSHGGTSGGSGVDDVHVSLHPQSGRRHSGLRISHVRGSSDNSSLSHGGGGSSSGRTHFALMHGGHGHHSSSETSSSSGSPTAQLLDDPSAEPESSGDARAGADADAADETTN